MTAAQTRPMLRLVSTRVEVSPRTMPIGNAHDQRRRDGWIHEVSHDRATPRGRVASENAAAAMLDEHDARWILARLTASLLETPAGHESAGVPVSPARLRPERRRRVHELATRLGLRAFDANLVIAVVQDAAMNDRDPLSRSCRSRLSYVGAPANSSRSSPSGAGVSKSESHERFYAAAIGVALGLVGAAMLVQWVAAQ